MSKTTRTLVVCATAFSAILSRSDAQKTDAAFPAFEVADIHASTPGANSNVGGGFIRGGRYELHAATMVDLIRTAYAVDADEVIGGPSWLDTDRFDVIAKGPAGATSESLKSMLQALLADRFK